MVLDSFPRCDRVSSIALALLAVMAAVATSGCSYSRPAKPSARPSIVKVKKKQATPAQTEDAADLGGDFEESKTLRGDLPLAGTHWELEGNLETGHYEDKKLGGGYRLEFKPNGWFEFQTDCRQGKGVYEIKGQRIAMAVVKANPSTCRQGSQADHFIQHLEAAKNFSLDKNKLFIDEKHGSKTMVFQPVP